MPQDPRFDGDNRFVNRADKVEPTRYDVDQMSLRLDWDISDTMSLHYAGGQSDGHDIVNQDFDGGDINGAAIPFAQLHTLTGPKVRDQDTRSYDWMSRSANSFQRWSATTTFGSDLEFRQDTNNISTATLTVAIFGLPAEVPCAAALALEATRHLVLESFCQFPNARSTQLAGETVDSKRLVRLDHLCAPPMIWK